VDRRGLAVNAATSRRRERRIHGDLNRAASDVQARSAHGQPLAAGILCAAIKLAFDLGSVVLLAVAIGFFTATVGVAAVVYRAFRRYLAEDEMRSDVG
jgi:hypothetical protein